MVVFKDLVDGSKFFVRGGFELQKVYEADHYNAVLLEAPSISVNLPRDEPTFNSLDEVRAAYPEDCQIVDPL
ncbi:unknown function [Klebsiella phage vB_Kpl_K72PH164C2]|uniref:Uncharacterized protein n=1 Tax=Klebsiella phage vB_Kpl_K72PH164C2 TaxID=3071646 RepID=A0AAD2GRW5_9CAUD|nr:unknown function [Klebsiella phage vB_Kpl_K72PH164C2]